MAVEFWIMHPAYLWFAAKSAGTFQVWRVNFQVFVGPVIKRQPNLEKGGRSC
jgi:hypothetical protein